MRAVSENFPFLANQMEYCNTKMPFLKHYENHGNHKRIKTRFLLLLMSFYLPILTYYLKNVV